MPSCLGFYTDKNMIKYAKVSKEKNSDVYILDAYGVKFYDNMITTIDDIAQEVGTEQCTLSLALNNEGYHSIEVFSGLKTKDRNALVESEFSAYCEEKNMISSALEIRCQLVQNTGDIDKFLSICAYVSKGELANVNTNFEGFKVSAVTPLGLSITNIFRNKAIDEEAAIVNIESVTTITIVLRNEIQNVIQIPLGMTDILDKLAEKYNSYSKAYEACKKVSVYIDDVTALDEESRDILDAVLPVLYDIRQRVDETISPYKRLLKAIYISGSIVTVNNVDLYFQENFPGLRCEMAKPFFAMQADKGLQKEIIEVNSATAVALNGLGMLDPDIDFHYAAKKVRAVNPAKKFIDKLNLGDKVSGFKETINNFLDEQKSRFAAPKKGRKVKTSVLDKVRNFFKILFTKKNTKVKVSYDAGDYDNQQAYVEQPVYAKTSGKHNFSLDSWIVRLTITCIGAFAIYFAVASYTTMMLKEKIALVDQSIVKVEAEILKASGDAQYIRARASEYSDKISKLEAVMQEIATEKRKSTFDIPNFMSQVMFIIPQGVTITNINISDIGEVEIDAISPQYAQLGYFVSRLKLENVIKDVDMQVMEMGQNIRIKVGGMLP